MTKTIPSFQLSSLPVSKNTTNKKTMASMNTALVRYKKKLAVIGLMTAVTPKTSVEFMITLPIRSPKASSVFFFLAATP